MAKPLFLLFPALLLIFSCKKDSFTKSDSALIGLSADSVYFDTLFTATGSTTQSVKIYNLNDQKILLSSVELAGGPASPFSINIDGAPGPAAGALTLEANDSLYLFIKVQIKASAASRPFILRDSIRLSYNGNTTFIQLSAWGQNAHFLNNQHISANTDWPNDMPYVITGSLTIDSNATLTLETGTRLFFHADAPLLVDGTLLANGTAGDSNAVYFASDRLDNPYNTYPGSWPGIYFRQHSKDNQLVYASVQNAYQAIVVEDPASDGSPKLIMKQCRIGNAYDAGIIGVQSSIQATNCLISNCGKNITLGYGGTYAFTHCTIAGYSNSFVQHQQPDVTLSNFVVNGAQILTSDLQADFTNCIVYGTGGSFDDEFVVSKQGGSIFNLQLVHCLLREKNFPAGVDPATDLVNEDPLFVKTDNLRNQYDFHLQPLSPAQNAGVNAGVTVDLDGKPRPVGLPDIGCFENQ